MVGSRVYVGGLPYGVRERDLERFFKGYGRTREILIKNGYGFVVCMCADWYTYTGFPIWWPWCLRVCLREPKEIIAHLKNMKNSILYTHRFRDLFSGIRRPPGRRWCGLWVERQGVTRAKVRRYLIGTDSTWKRGGAVDRRRRAMCCNITSHLLITFGLSEYTDFIFIKCACALKTIYS